MIIKFKKTFYLDLYCTQFSLHFHSDHLFINHSVDLTTLRTITAWSDELSPWSDEQNLGIWPPPSIYNSCSILGHMIATFLPVFQQPKLFRVVVFTV